MVREGWTDQSDQQVFVVEQLKETAGYVERMPGGVREGGREASPYSIITAVKKVVASKAFLMRCRLWFCEPESGRFRRTLILQPGPWEQ